MFSADPESYTVVLAWPLESAIDLLGSYRWVQGMFEIADPSEGWGLPAAGIVLPAVASNQASQAPLVAWWILLYGFSMLARYQPRDWTKLLDVDSSPDAVPVEMMLATAASAIPRLLLAALLDNTP